MKQTTISLENEAGAREAFNAQSVVFDEIYGSDEIIQYKRRRVRDHMLALMAPGAQVLELNCGTGEDALFFARSGYRLHATDISEGMLSVLNQKLHKENNSCLLTTEQCSFTELDQLKNQGPFDHVFSNFGGLNCTSRLDQVIESIDGLVKPGGIITLVLISRFCLWEFLLLFRGKFAVAFRRFFSGNGRKAHIEGRYFRCWYYSPSYVKHCLPHYEVLGVEGLCTLVPPSYLEGFTKKWPALFSFLRARENRWKNIWPWRSSGDYFIISLRKR